MHQGLYFAKRDLSLFVCGTIALVVLNYSPTEVPKMLRWFNQIFTICSALAIASMPLSASACPTCKEGLLENGQTGLNLARGFELSIYLMLGAPLLIVSTLALVFYFQIRQAKRLGTYPDVAQLIAQAEASQRA